MAEQQLTEKQLAGYEPRTTSGAALKERLEAASGSTEETPQERRVLR